MVCFTCNVCDKVFQYKKNLNRHSKNAHGIDVNVNGVEKEHYICNLCLFSCTVKKQLICHLRIDHNFWKRESRLICSLCDGHVKSYQCLDEHLSRIHGICIEEEYFEFEKETEFRTWKLNVEKETGSQYVTIRGIWKLKTGLRREYVCHRSFKSNVKATGRKRAIRSFQSKKIAAACPSRMIVTITPEKVQVNFVRKHIGHSLEIIGREISTNPHADISGVAVQRLLDDIQDSRSPENFDRLAYILRKDIYNIIRDFSIGYMTIRHPEDPISVAMLVTTLEKLPNSPILHYNPQDEDFSLIIMTEFQKMVLKSLGRENKIGVDSAQGLNSYGYQLISIVVIDELNTGIPVAFCFSKKTDFAAVILFFTKVKEAVGCVIESKVFMSDDTSQFYDAWTAVMKKPENRLICWWHVNKNWSKNLGTKINNTGKRELVKKTLYLLATDISDEHVFEYNLDLFMNYLKADKDTKSFHDYFLSYYVPKKNLWAFCFRKYLGLDMNMHLENLNFKIKHIYLEGKPCIRLDKAVNTLFRLIRDTMLERIIILAKNTPIEKINDAHQKLVQIPDADLCQMQPELWHVKAQHDKQLVYEVRRISEECHENNLCILRCPECEVCIHSFQCSCADNVVYLNICQHIHKVAITTKIDSDRENKNSEYRNDQVQETIELLDTHPEPNDVQPIEVEEEVRAKLLVLLGRLGKLSEENLRVVSEKMDALLTSTHAEDGSQKENPQNNKYPPVESEPCPKELIKKEYLSY